MQMTSKSRELLLTQAEGENGEKNSVIRSLDNWNNRRGAPQKEFGSRGWKPMSEKCPRSLPL